MQKQTHGGARPGAGRKSEIIDVTSLNIRIGSKLLENIRKKAKCEGVTTSEWIRDALAKACRR